MMLQKERAIGGLGDVFLRPTNSPRLLAFLVVLGGAFGGWSATTSMSLAALRLQQRKECVAVPLFFGGMGTLQH